MRMTKGIQARATRRAVNVSRWLAVGVSEDPSPGSSVANRQMSRDRQSRITTTPAIRLETDETISTSSKPTKFDHKNWTEANVPPMTTSGTRTSQVLRQPARVATSQNGITRERIGKIRPDVALRAWTSSSVTRLSVRIGMPMPPQATGAVLAIRQSNAAWNGWNPNPTRNAAEIATGAPKPAAPSMSAPKQNATRTAWSRRSADSRATEVFITSNCPVATVMSYRNTAATISQIMRKIAKTTLRPVYSPGPSWPACERPRPPRHKP